MRVQVGDWVKYRYAGKIKIGEVVHILGNSFMVIGSQRQLFLASIIETRGRRE